MNLPPTKQEPANRIDSARWFAEEVQPHETALRNWLRVRFPILTDRDDVIQESLLRVWRAQTESPIISGKAFLFATARNLALDTMKRRRPQNDLGETGVSVVLDEGDNPAESLVHTQEFELLKSALESLPERCREVFTLRRLHGLSQKEIAARLGISEKTVEAQNTIAMHKCVQFFQQVEAQPACASQPLPQAAMVAIPSTPQHV